MSSEPRSDIDISHIPASGIGGLGLVATAVGVTIGMPQLRWLGVASLVGGIAIGLFLIGSRNKRARRATEVGGLILVLAVAAGLWLYFR